MCILCVVQRWSRRVAAMLLWLVVPLLVLWILSQLLPPNLRFEITSPRLACVIVLLVTLFWYETLVPKLSIWRARRSAMLRERSRTQAIELQKLRRSATRRCRNCLTPYREQNPCGGKFTCSYCGHVSKRPVLDLSVWPDLSGECGGPGDVPCLTEKSYSGVYRAAYSVIFSAGRFVRKVFRIGQREGGPNGENNGLSGKRGESGGSFQESRVEKARRKAEEKRQARVEREILEEEERKQREEVARLVDERRKLRDEMLEVERGRMKSSSHSEMSRKETEKRKKERRRGEKEKGSSKSNSDGEEQERMMMSREGANKREFDKKGEMERQKALVETVRSQVAEAAHGNKPTVSKTRYFDRVKGTFLSSSRGFNGSFFGRNAQSVVAPATKATKPASGFVDHGHNAGTKRDTHPTSSTMGKSTVNGDPRPAGIDLQPRVPAPKKGWHQLFTRSSSAVSPDLDTNATSFVNLNVHVEATNAMDTKVLPYTVDSGFNFGQSLPLSCYSSPNGSSNGRSFSHIGADSLFPPMKEPTWLEDAELFEDPCYVPDSASLLGPVSESLGNFQLDLGVEFIENNVVEGPCVLKNVTALPEPKPSPIESPSTKLRVSEERQSSGTPKTPKLHALDFNGSSNAQTWQMWGAPLAHEGLGLAGGPYSWFSPLVQNTADQNANHPLAQESILPHIGKDNYSLPSIRTQKNCGNNHHGGKFSLLGPGLNGNDQWVCNSPMQPALSVDREGHFLPLDLIDNMARNEGAAHSSPKSSAPTYPVLPANGWFKEEWAFPCMKEAGNSTPVRPPNIGGLFSTSPDVQSVWSYNHQ